MNKIFFLGLIFLSSVFAQENTFSAKGFKVVEYAEDGKLKSILKGQKGSRFGNEVKINGVKYEIFNKESKLNLLTPECTYNFDSKSCNSKEAVKVIGDGVKITGVGFDIDNNQKKIFIRSKVKVIWEKAKIQDKKSPKENK